MVAGSSWQMKRVWFTSMRARLPSVSAPLPLRVPTRSSSDMLSAPTIPTSSNTFVLCVYTRTQFPHKCGISCSFRNSTYAVARAADVLRPGIWVSRVSLSFSWQSHWLCWLLLCCWDKCRSFLVIVRPSSLSVNSFISLNNKEHISISCSGIHREKVIHTRGTKAWPWPAQALLSGWDPPPACSLLELISRAAKLCIISIHRSTCHAAIWVGYTHLELLWKTTMEMCSGHSWSSHTEFLRFPLPPEMPVLVHIHQQS